MSYTAIDTDNYMHTAYEYICDYYILPKSVNSTVSNNIQNWFNVTTQRSGHCTTGRHVVLRQCKHCNNNWRPQQFFGINIRPRYCDQHHWKLQGWKYGILLVSRSVLLQLSTKANGIMNEWMLLALRHVRRLYY